MKLHEYIKVSVSKSFRRLKKRGLFPICLGSVFILLYFVIPKISLSRRGCFLAVCAILVAVSQIVAVKTGPDE